MATYVIGDVHGCLEPLTHLLDKIAYSNTDKLYFVGDLVNRGPKSLETLLFIKSLHNTRIILGNHDLHLLALAYKVISRPTPHPTDNLLNSPRKIALIEWLRHQPLMHKISNNSFMVHAGIPPQWDISTAMQQAQDVEQVMQSDHINKLLELLYSQLNTSWSEQSDRWQRLQYTALAFTQMRRCTQLGEIELKFNDKTITENLLKPWFEWYQQPENIIFGHWAALNGESTHPRCIATDTGCVWGGKLSAYHVEKQCFIRTDGYKQHQLT
jgi:bis(5'-nucleosyl)-tetraphosphatase (symmetrical)